MMELEALRQPGRVDGIDVSAIQGKIDYDRVAAAGFRFVVAKVAEGVGYCDPRGAANLAAARATGLYALAYSFARPSQGRAREQVRKLWDCMGDTMVHRAVLDLEGAPDAMSPAEIVAFGEEWIDEWAAHSGLRPMFYSYPSFINERMRGAVERSEVIAACPLWIAQYRSTTVAWAPSAVQQPGVPKPWKRWDMWQYSGNGGYRVPGVAVDCDRNLFNGDERALRDFLGLPDPSADSEPTLRVPSGDA